MIRAYATVRPAKTLTGPYSLSVFTRPSRPTALASENRGLLLFMQPLEEFLKASVGQNDFHSVKRVTKLIVAPSLVDEILARMAGRNDFCAAFAAWDHVMSPSWDLSATKNTEVHKTFAQHIECAQN